MSEQNPNQTITHVLETFEAALKS
ncbi:MAG: hypothetical protein JWL96_3904, partial [Sphingomonas bacterium]|nr:hypothetical protein [Sphingomonas bacterium]